MLPLFSICPKGHSWCGYFVTVTWGLRDMRDARRGVCARSQLKWQRDGDEWVLLYRRRRRGRVVPDPANPGMYRSLKSGDFSDISNLSWAKDAVLVQAIREVAYELANDPKKCPVKWGSQRAKSSPIRFSEKAA